ncbi:hypothetical protein Rctr16k_12 [Virus Rctr16k]|nr:hypothetical protein Rctr16k_12 [Virus Rctr16k]
MRYFDMSEAPFDASILDFADMAIRSTARTRDAPVLHYCVRRTHDGKWQLRPTSETWKHLFDYHTRALAEGTTSIIPKLELEHLGMEPQWSDLPDHLVARLEPRYQRFLLHWRGPG